MVQNPGGSTEKTHRQRWWRVNDNGGFSFLFVSFMLFSSFGFLYTYVVYKNNNHVNTYGKNMLGCHEDSEGSWSIGVFYGDSPFSLKPIESVSTVF